MHISLKLYFYLCYLFLYHLDVDACQCREQRQPGRTKTATRETGALWRSRPGEIGFTCSLQKADWFYL